MADPSQLSMEEIFRMLDSNNPELVNELQRLFYEALSETREPWLVCGLYDHHAATQSAQSLRLLTSVKEPHDRLLLDRLAEGLRCAGTGRAQALHILGSIVRRQPTWLHRAGQHPLLPALLKLLRSEAELDVVVPALLVLTALLPSVSARLGPLLPDLFAAFGALAALGSRAPSPHLTIGLYSLFHRLYGMFPCNFLSWLRGQYPESGPGSAAFRSVIAPLLASARLHPLLVTQSRDTERSPARWKGLSEVHDVVAECSRYCVSSPELDPPAPPRPKLASRPGSKLALDSPPEAAVEATPDNTPYATPVKSSPPPRVGRPAPPPALRSLGFRSPAPPPSPGKPSAGGTPGAESSPFVWPEPGPDGVFQEMPANLLAKRDSLGLGLLLGARAEEGEDGLPDAEVAQLLGQPRARHLSSARATPLPRPEDPTSPGPPPPCVEELVRRVRTRVRGITLCEVLEPAPPLARSASCPALAPTPAPAPPTGDRGGAKLRFTSGTQTEDSLLPHELLLPLALPHPPPRPAPPAAALDAYVAALLAGRDPGSAMQVLPATVLPCYSATQLQCYSATVLQCYSATVLQC
jgi:tuberous sclerosis protein 1